VSLPMFPLATREQVAYVAARRREAMCQHYRVSISLPKPKPG